MQPKPQPKPEVAALNPATRKAVINPPSVKGVECVCSCHKVNRPGGMCICCEAATKPFMQPPISDDKSKELLDKFLKGKK